MKKILIIILFLFTSLNAQTKYAWLSDIHIGSPFAEEDLEGVVNTINKMNEIEFVIATGDIAEKGRNDELQIAKNILDNLNIPYYIIPGNHDTKWSESGVTKFKELWKDDKFYFQYKNSHYIGLNSGIPWRGGGGHFDIEDIKWLASVVENIPADEEIYFYSHHPLDGDADNWFKVTNILREKNIKAVFVGHGHSNRLLNFNGIPAAMGRSTLRKNKPAYGFTLVESLKDTIIFYEVSGDSVYKSWGGISKNLVLNIPKVDSLQFINYNADIKFTKELEATLSAVPLIANNNIYAAAKNGKVYCLDMNGNIKWTYDTRGTIFSKPAYANGILIVGTIEGDLITLDANNGKLIQIIGLGEAITSQLITYELKRNDYEGSTVIVGTSNGNLYCYDIENLELIWENNSAEGMIETKPLIINDRIIFGSWDFYVYNIDAKSGGLNWRWTENRNFYYSNAACNPVTDGKFIYVASPDKYVSAIDLLLGTTVWRKNEGESWESIGITSNKNFILIKGYMNKFFFLNPKDGKIHKTVDLKYGLDTMPVEPIEVNGNVLFGSKNGTVNLIDKNYKHIPLMFTGTARVHSVQHIEGKKFLTSNMDGKITVFEIK